MNGMRFCFNSPYEMQKTANTTVKHFLRGDTMKATGIVRRIDELGRIVVPKEIRRVMRIREGDPIEIFTEDGRVVLQKYARMRELGTEAETYCRALSGALGLSAGVTDTETVRCASGALKKRLMNARLSDACLRFLNERRLFSSSEGAAPFSDVEPVRAFAAVPILVSGDLSGCVFLATDDARLPIREPELAALKTAALYLGSLLEG